MRHSSKKHRQARSLGLVVAASALLTLMSDAGAQDGIVEINDACAALTGCFDGDTPGYPVTIDGSAGNSYRLTGNLTVPDANTRAIDVLIDAVVIDLAGFEIARSDCVAASCSMVDGSGIAIRGNDFLSVSNGSIAGFGAGVRAGDNARVHNVHVRSTWGGNKGAIGLDERSTVSGSSVSSWVGIGIALGGQSDVRNAKLFGTLDTQRTGATNGDRGVSCIDCYVGDSAFQLIDGTGISCDRCLVEGNFLQHIYSDGISVSDAQVLRNTVSLCGPVFAVGTDNEGGIYAPGSIVAENTVSLNFGSGILKASIARGNIAYDNFSYGLYDVVAFEGNAISDNRKGHYDAAPASFGGNTCNGGTCP